MADALQLTIQTPHARVFAGPVRSIRAPTPTGLVGLRPRGEPLVLAVDSGLTVLQLADASDDDGVRFVATTGGLLESARATCNLYTPFAAIGSSEQAMLDALAQVLSTPSLELVARRRLAELERRILREIREAPAGPGSVVRSHG